MKADPAVQRRLLDLAQADAELARVEHRRRTLPELVEVAELEKSVQAKRDTVVSVQMSLSDLESDIKRQEKEVDAVRAREERDRKLLDSGLGGKQQVDIEHELNTLQRRQGALEDDLLELMEQREAVQGNIENARIELEKAEAGLAEAGERRDAAMADLETVAVRRGADREGLLGEFPSDLLALYQRVRQQKGIGAALLRARKCGACQIELDRTAIAQITRAAADEVVRCEECGAILVRTAESGL
ncbi:MAG: zinc ribbon domain-containing protein [Sciscionella sp.]